MAVVFMCFVFMFASGPGAAPGVPATPADAPSHAPGAAIIEGGGRLPGRSPRSRGAPSWARVASSKPIHGRPTLSYRNLAQLVVSGKKIVTIPEVSSSPSATSELTFSEACELVKANARPDSALENFRLTKARRLIAGIGPCPDFDTGTGLPRPSVPRVVTLHICIEEEDKSLTFTHESAPHRLPAEGA